MEKVLRMLSHSTILYYPCIVYCIYSTRKGAFGPTRKKWGGPSPPPAHNFASSRFDSWSLHNSRLRKIYMVVNMKYAICRGSVLPDRLGLNQCLLIGKPPPPILDLLSDVIPPSIENFMHSEMERGGLN